MLLHIPRSHISTTDLPFFSTRSPSPLCHAMLLGPISNPSRCYHLSHLRAPLSQCFTRCMWSPPPEPEKPPVPYRQGYRFTARRVQPPPPFLGQYVRVPDRDFRHFLKTYRFPGKDFLRTTTLVNYCMTVASKPLPCEPLHETSDFEVLEEITVGDGPGRGRGSQVIVCKRQGTAEPPLVAKVFDPLYYPSFNPVDSPAVPINVVSRAEHDFALESAAYVQLDHRLGGRFIPRFYGSWILDLPLKNITRPVGFVLMEHLEGIPLSELDPANYSRDERLRMLALSMEAEVEIFHSGVWHYGISPRNVICSTADFQSPDLSVKIIDFGNCQILPLRGAEAPCESEPLPKSPLESFWSGGQVDMWNWQPPEMGASEWNQWLQERWAGSSKYQPPPDNLMPATNDG